MRVYVSGSSAEIDRAQNASSKLRGCDIEVVSTWPEVIESVGIANSTEASRSDRIAWSSKDLAEVARAHVLWCLVPETVTRGAWIEVGYSIARNIDLVFSGDTRRSIFCALGEEFLTDDEAFERLRILAKVFR